MWSTPVRLCTGSPDIADWCVLRAIELEDLKADTAPCARYAIFLFYNAMLYMRTMSASGVAAQALKRLLLIFSKLKKLVYHLTVASRSVTEMVMEKMTWL